MAADAEAELGSEPQPEQGPGARAAELTELRDMARAEAAELQGRVRQPAT